MLKLRRIVLSALVVSAAVFWILRGLEAYGRWNYKVTVIGRTDLFLLNGARLNLADPEVFRVARGDKRGSATRTLLIVESDSCLGVRELLPKWIELIQDLPSDGSVAVVAVNVGGNAVSEQLAAAAKKKSVPYQVLEIVDHLKYASRTGFTSTPWTLVLDSESRVRRVSMAVDYMASNVVQSDFRGCLLTGSCVPKIQ